MSKTPGGSPTNVFIDLDGTLLDVSRRHYAVYRDLLREWGKVPLPPERYWALKRANTRLGATLAESGAAGLIDAFRHTWLERIERRDYLDMDTIVGGGREMLVCLGADHRLILVTLRHSSESLAQQLDALSLRELFQAVLTAGHPNADYSVKARLIEPHQSSGAGWLVGDTELDVEAARAVGLPCCAVTWGLRSRSLLEALRPDALVDDVEAIPRVVASLRASPGRSTSMSRSKAIHEGSRDGAGRVATAAGATRSTVAADPALVRRVIAFLPVFNEEAHIDVLLEGFRPVLERGVIDEVLVVDDGSTDRTPAILQKYDYCTVITHPSRQGCGDAIRSAYRYALTHDYDIFVIMAGNGKDDPAQIERLIAPILGDAADYVQGSRFLPGGQSEGLPGHRLWAIRLFTWTFSLFLVRRYTDCTNGFRAYRTATMRDPRLDWSQEWLGHSYEIEFYMHYMVASLGYRVKEVPVSKIYRPARDGSYTKVRLRDWLTNLKPLFLLRFGLRR